MDKVYEINDTKSSTEFMTVELQTDNQQLCGSVAVSTPAC
jgi:hypothetical protein